MEATQLGEWLMLSAASEEAHPGVRGYITTLGSTTNDQFGGSAGIEVGTERWLLWANGGGQRAGDYRTPLGTISNSFVRAENGSGGVGYFREKGFLSLNYTIDRRNYGYSRYRGRGGRGGRRGRRASPWTGTTQPAP
jgi:iron complex outermembrane receptor protein